MAVDRSKVGKKARGKGQRGERILVKKFAEWWGSEFFRTPGSGSFATRGFSRKAMDVAGDIVTLDESFPWCVESKNAEGWTLDNLFTEKQGLLRKWWQQAVDQCPDHKLPLLVFTRNRQPIYFMHNDVEFWDFRMFGIHTSIDGVEVFIGLLSDLLDTDPTQWQEED